MAENQTDMDTVIFRDWLPKIESLSRELQELVLTNLVMINEQPSPTFREAARSKIFCERVSAARSLAQWGIDEKDNGVGILAGKNPKQNILIVSHLDTHFTETYNHQVCIQSDTVSGVGVADNGLGAAVNAALPLFLERLGYQPNANIIFMGSSRSLGSGNLEGLRFFLDQGKRKIDYGICLEGVELGRLSYTSHGVVQGTITYRMHSSSSYNESMGALYYLTEIINALLAYPLPSKPKTVISLTSIRAGHAFNRTATEGSLNLEIRGEDSSILENLSNFIDNLAEEYSFKANADIRFRRLSVRMSGGIPYGSPLVQKARSIFEILGIIPQIYPSRSELAAFISRGIPAITIGISKANNVDTSEESICLNLLQKGIVQVLALLISMDQDFIPLESENIPDSNPRYKNRNERVS